MARRALHKLSLFVPAAIAEEVGAFVVSAGAGAVEERTATDGDLAELVVYSADRAHLGRLARQVEDVLGKSGIAVGAAIGKASLDAARWETTWTEHLGPVRISRTLVLAPTTAPGPGAGAARVVLLEPAMAFGFGDHPTTRLAARAVERFCRRGAPSAVLDVGTGSGVLALVAALSGARRAVGIDVDPRAVIAARRNAALNGVAARCRFSRAKLAQLPGRYPLVVANIDAQTLMDSAKALRRRLSAGGTLLLTGILSGDAAEVLACYTKLGFQKAALRREREWVLLELLRAGRVTPRGRAASRSGTARRAPRETARRTSRTPRSRSRARRA